MRKSKFKKKLTVAFWVVFLSGCLWVAFAPHTKIEPPSVIVKVEQPPLSPSPQPEEAQPAPPPTFAGEEPAPENPPPPQIGNVTVPVIPETPEIVPSGHLVKIAIVIDDVGPDLKGSERAIALPAPVTLSFLPYAVRVREQAKEAQDKGHELILHMPMEPVGHESPGPGALLVDLPLPELRTRLDAALASFTGMDGINNHMGSKFTAYEEGMAMVVDDLKERHLFFFDSRTSAQSVGFKVAKEKGLPSIARDVFLDDDPSPEAIRKQLELTEHIARRKGYAVAIGHPHATTMDVLETWTTTEASKQEIELVPLNSLVEGK
jgi:polysaccharide deacetylase 2 family uncharacterized protein YibQ